MINTLNMRPLIRFTFTLFVLCLTFIEVFAGSGTVRPVHTASFQISNKQVYKLDSFLRDGISVITVKKESDLTAEEAASSKTRICSCQILNLESSNYDHRQVVLLAEKTNDGSTSAYAVAKERLQKEKKHLKNMFYDKVQVVAEMQAAGSCKAMFYQLRTKDKNVQLYEILDADIHQIH